VPGEKNTPKVAAVRMKANWRSNSLKRQRAEGGSWAPEPLLANPVAICTDEKGRWYVAETFRLHAGVTDIREHMELAQRRIGQPDRGQRDAYMNQA